MTISVLCESPRVRRPQEKCASKYVRGTLNSLPSSDFLAQAISNLKL
jgi:hypothetical protein